MNKLNFPMKKFALLLSSLLLLSSCDDGDLVFEELNFTAKDIQTCNSLYYKINGKELLLVNLANSNNGLVLDENAPLNQVQNISTSDLNKIYYRTYSETVNQNTICSTIPPAQPVVVSEYVSNSGALIQYIRRSNVGYTNNKATINYNYTINFKNVTLSNGTSQIKYEDYPFGTFIYKTNTLGFVFTNFTNCNSQLISADSDEELIFTLSTPYTDATTIGEQIYNLSDNQFLTYNLYEGNIVNQAACDEKSNAIKEQWIATSGSYVIKISEVVNQVTQNVDALKQEFYLRNVTFNKDGLSFTIDELKIQEQTISLQNKKSKS